MWTGLNGFDPRAEALLDRLLGAERLSHAYLITGPGREEFARRMAAALLCTGEKKPCGSCPHCRKTAAGIHPDVTCLRSEEGKAEITVDQVRRLRADAYIRPNEGERKLYLIEEAQRLNPSAQNALLKVLEEGPAYVVFLLTAEGAGQLLPTIRSRCGEIFLSREEEGTPTPEGEALARLLLDGEERALLARCVELEGLSREEWRVLLADTIQALTERIHADSGRAGEILPLIEQLKVLWDAAQFPVGTGHLAGWLCASTIPLIRRTL